ncbi:hypothetical protein SLS53_005709 [Cytospora paraplurivora]|uniref:Uncharacterized protein n=1 Tax=Cytospora paraplurivora TaxID=2898453 RepID=A0AAN9YEV6_9PEZI
MSGFTNDQTVNTSGANTTNSGAATQEDYVDKAFDFGAKKSGHSVNRSTAEKITDGGRNLFEKATGKKVSDKVSN